MNLSPRNRHVVATPCECPREQGDIKVDQCLPTAVVEAIDETPRGNPSLDDWIKVGDVIYFRPGEAIRIYADNNQQRVIIHESMILSVVRGIEAVRKEIPFTESKIVKPSRRESLVVQ